MKAGIAHWLSNIGKLDSIMNAFCNSTKTPIFAQNIAFCRLDESIEPSRGSPSQQGVYNTS